MKTKDCYDREEKLEILTAELLNINDIAAMQFITFINEHYNLVNIWAGILGTQFPKQVDFLIGIDHLVIFTTCNLDFFSDW